MIDAFAQIAGVETNICVKGKHTSVASSEPVTGNFLIVVYSPKAIAVFGDTRQVKDRLKTLGGRYNPCLTHENEIKAGWVFPMSKEQQVRSLLIN
jgi:hypothetical protein